MKTLTCLWQWLIARLNTAGEYIPPLFLRLILFAEFYEAGMMKLHGENWFSSIHSSFPWPFGAEWFSDSLSWQMAMWAEIIGSILLLLGLFTRFAAFSLLIVTAVATAAVHWPESWNSLGELWQGYVITNKGAGNFKLPLLFSIMLLPLIFNGAGKISLDHLLAKMVGINPDAREYDFATAGLALMVIGAPLVFLLPGTGWALTLVGAGFLIANRAMTPTD
jgi:putative oxidoreductase